MKLLQLLKNRTGAISGTRALVAGVLVTSAALTIHSYFQNPTEPNQTEVRRVADLMSQHADLPPEYASIDKSFSLGRYNGQFADAEEIAKYNGDITIGSDSADALESGNLMGQVFSGDNGLGLGNKDVDVSASTTTGNVVDPEGRARSAIKNVRGGEGGAGEGAAQTEKEDAGSKVNKLQNATIAHANGNNLSSSNFGSDSSATGSSRGVKTRPVTPTSVNPEASVISGSMDAGSSSLVKSNNRFVDPSYKPSRDDIKGYKNKTPRETTESDFVKRVTKISKRMARKRDKSDNETVTTAFMEGQETTISYDTGNEFTKSSNEILPENDGLDNDENLGEIATNTTDEMAEYNNQKSIAQNHLLNMCLGLIPMVIGAFFGIALLMEIARKPGPQSGGALAAAIVLGAVMAGMVAIYMGFAISFITNYTDAPAAGWVHTGIGALFLTTIGLAFLKGTGKAVSKISGSAISKALGFGAAGVSLTGAIPVVKEFVDAGSDGSFSAERPESLDEKEK